MNTTKRIQPNLTIENITPENGVKFTDAELDQLVGPDRITVPVAEENGEFFILDVKDEKFRSDEYVVIADDNYIGESNALAAVLTNQEQPEITGTILLAHKSHL